MNSSQHALTGDFLLSAYVALIGLMALTGIVLLFVPKTRRVAWLILCSVAVCLIGGAATYELYPLFCPPPPPAPPAKVPDGAGAIQSLIWIFMNSFKDIGPAFGWSIARMLNSYLISAIGLLVGWFPLWLWFQFRRQRPVEDT